MGKKNYISVSFQAMTINHIALRGMWLLSLDGKSDFQDIKEKILEGMLNKYDYKVNPDDITLTGISEISSRLYNRLGGDVATEIKK